MKQRFFTGLIILLPLVVTWWIVSAVIGIATGPFQSMTRSWLHSTGLFQNGGFLSLSETQAVSILSTILILLAIALGVYIIGMLGEWFFVRWIVAIFDNILLAMPFVNKIYKSCKDFTNILFKEDSKRFSQVVWVPFPSKTQRTMGLITNELQLPSHGEQKFVSVLVPGTPNPTVGYLLFFPKEVVQYTDIPTDEGMKWVISCGTSQAPHVVGSMRSYKETV